MEEKEIIKLSEKEVLDITTKQEKIEQYNYALGKLRHKYLMSENELLEKIQQSEIEYISFLKFLFQNKNDEDMNNWVFDSNNFVFKKK